MLEILYEDASVIVVWKPVGMESQSSRGFGADMVSEIRRHIHKLSPKSGEPYVGVIHRLDKPVSGILVYAKDKKAAAALSKQVSGGAMSKKYLAVLCGKPAQNVDNYVDYLLKEEKENRSRIVDKGITGAKQAKLRLRSLETRTVEPYGELTLAEVTLFTGRHHQIRVQMAGHGLPLWGDNRYNPMFGGTAGSGSGRSAAPAEAGGLRTPAGAGNLTPLAGPGGLTPPARYRRPTVALAAWQLSFTHPVTGKELRFERKPEGSIFQEFAMLSPEPQGSASQEQIIPTTGRNNCGGRCLLYAHVEDGKIVRMTTETQKDAEAAGCPFPLTACARGLNYHKTFLGEDRLRWPMKRVGERGEGKFQRISWDEAVDIIAREWIRIRDTYGPGSRYVNYATGVSALLRPAQLAKRLLSLDGGYLDYYNSYSTACIRHATKLMYGTYETGNDRADWLNSKLLILWSHNPAETVFDGDSMFYLRKAKEQGIPIIVVDPRYSDTARELDAEWIPLRPATDSALLDAMAYVIVSEGLQDQDFLDRYCLGFDKEHMPEGVDPSLCYRSWLMGEQDGVEKTPEWAEAITGVEAETIRSLARRYALARPAALIQGYGAQRHAYGEQSARGAILLACLTGNVGISGGWAGGVAVCTRHQNPRFPMPENPYPMKIPVFLWTDAVERGHAMTELDGVIADQGRLHLDSDIKMILNLAGNTLINQHSDINRTAALLKDTKKCEFIVCSDLFMTASARFADILLPGISMLECENITMPWQNGDFVGFTNQVTEPLYEGRFEYDWLAEVADRLGLKEAFTEGRTAGEWLRYCYEELRKSEPELPEYEILKEKGVYRYRENPPAIAFSEQRADLEHHPFPTESGKIEIFSKQVYETRFSAFFPPIPRYVAPPEGPQDPLAQRYPLQLIGWHTKRRCHSIHDNNRSMDRLDPQRLWIHPEDAAERGIKDGELAVVWNDRGEIRIPVKVTDRICKGVTALSQGAWYRPETSVQEASVTEGGEKELSGSGQDCAETEMSAPSQDRPGNARFPADLGGSINVLTSWEPTPYAKGNPQHTNLVQVKRFTR